MLRINLLIVALFFSTGAIAQMFQPQVTYPTDKGAKVVTTGDFNADGRQDAAIGTSYLQPYGIQFWLQNATGQLAQTEDFAVDRRIESIDTGDFNSDGLDDIVFSTTNYIGILITESNLTHTLIKVLANELRLIKVADFNRDGRDDIISVGWGSIEVHLQTNTGIALSKTIPLNNNYRSELEMADLDNNGFLDIIVLSGQGPTPTISIVYQTSIGFNPVVHHNLKTEIGAGIARGIAVGDLNGDNRKDIAISTGGNQPTARLAVMYQDATGLFSRITSMASYDVPDSVELADINLDGRLDVIMGHGSWGAVGVYLQQNGVLPLSAETRYPITSINNLYPQGLIVDDINSDGAPDIAIADLNEGLAVLYHTPVPAPSVDIKANGLDGWIQLNPASPLSLTIKVTPTIVIGKPANYYLVYQNSEGAWWLNSSNQWVKSQKPIIFYSGPAKILSKTLVKDTPKYGNYTLMVVVDDQFLWDYVSVTQ